MASQTPLLGGGSHTPAAVGAAGSAITSLMTFQLVATLLFGLFSTYSKKGAATGVGVKYSMLLDVSVMIFIGFGYLMTFLKKYGYSAVSFTFCVSAVVIEWSILNVGFWGCLDSNKTFGAAQCKHDGRYGLPQFGVGIDEMIQGMFAAAAVMISFGALIGKASFDQMVVVALFETTFYALNCYIYFNTIEAADVGGSVVIHTFGAYFGLAASLFLTPRGKRRDFSDNGSTYHSDLFAFIGTVFLWIYWPSFNGITAPLPLQERAIVNTMLSLLSSCIVSFFCSRRFRGEGVFDAVDIQNATLAGGVAMGTACTLPLEPYGAILLGGLAGGLSCAGYAFLLDKLEAKGVHDTCGVNNLHGMPGVLGGLAGVLVMGTATTATAKEQALPHGKADQWMYQLLGLVVTLVIALTSGALTGMLVDRLVPRNAKVFYTDETHWSVPTSQLTFTENDINHEAPRKMSVRQRRSAKRNWKKMGAAVKVISMFKGGGGGGGGGEPINA